MSFPVAQPSGPNASNGAPGQRFVSLREYPRQPWPPVADESRAGVSAPPPLRQSLSPDGVSWVAAHGGAGTSTLTTVLGGVDLGCRWPDPAQAEPARVLLVARTHAGGILAASRALNALREGRHPDGLQLIALVLVADSPGRLPQALRRQIRMLRSAVRMRQIPWIPEWRLGRTPKKLPKEVVRLSAMAGPAAADRTW
jgi:hypothetical protein